MSLTDILLLFEI